MSIKNNEVAISVNGISKYFAPSAGQQSMKRLFTSLFRKTDEKKQGYWALKDINFEIKKGEFFGIVGRNGSGKSTLLKLIAGVYTPTGGAIQVNGKLVPFIELGVGFNPELSGRDNVFLNGALLGFSRKEMESMYKEIVDFAELKDHMDVKLKNFSSGMQVRLAFSIAIRAKADVLLIDEVLAVGDAAFQRKCFDYFDMLKKDKKTVVFVTHDMSAVQRFCDRSIVINDSKLLGVFTPDEAKAEYFGITDESTGKVISSNDRELRWGSGEVRIELISTLDSNGKKTKTYKTREDIVVKLSIKNNSLKQDELIVVGANILSESGENLLGPNTSQLEVKAGMSELILKIKTPNLNDGLYKISTAIFNPSYSILYDHFEKGGSFRVSGSNKSLGLLLLDSNWSVR